MKRFNWLLIGVIVFSLAVLPLVGCVSKSEYEALQTEHATLVDENTSLKTGLETTQSDLASLQIKYEGLQASYKTLKTELNNTKAALDETNVNLQDARSQIVELESIYPPRHFNNYAELKDWVDLHFVGILKKWNNTYKNHLSLQKIAMSEGFVWFIAYNPDYKLLSYFGTGEGYGPHAGSAIRDIIMPYRNLHASVIAGNDIYSVYMNGEIIWAGLVDPKLGRYTDNTALEPRFPPTNPYE